MYPKPLQHLIDLFTKLPGIGPRQATRFAFSILKNPILGKDIALALTTMEQEITICSRCFRTLEKNEGTPRILCNFCVNAAREQQTIAVVEKESDLQNLEKTGAFHGVYHVLGGVVSPLDMDSPTRLHLRELHERIKATLEDKKNCEVILATNSTTEGDTTALYIERILAPLKDAYLGLTISRLGRGLSLGSELEYADETTLKNALTNRK